MKTDQRARFEDRLLAELSQVVAERPEPALAAAPAARTRQWFSWKLRLAAVAAAAAAGVAVAVAVPLVASQDSSPAYAVTVRDDGTVGIEIKEFRDPEGLERELEEAGIPAEVDYLPPGKRCKEPRYTPSDTVLRRLTPNSAGVRTLTIDPATFPDSDTLVITTTWRNGRDLDEGSLSLAVATGPVRPCEPVS